MFNIMRRRKGANGARRWTGLNEPSASNEDRAPLDAQVFTLNQDDPVFEFAVFEQLDSPLE